MTHFSDDERDDLARMLCHTQDQMAAVFPEKPRSVIDAQAAMALDVALQHGFTEQGYNAFMQLMELEG